MPGCASRRISQAASRSKTTSPRVSLAYSRCARGSRYAGPPRPRRRVRVLTLAGRRPSRAGPRLRPDLRHPDPALALPVWRRRRGSARFLAAGPVLSQRAGHRLPVSSLRSVSSSAPQGSPDLTPANGRPAPALHLVVSRCRCRRPGWFAEWLQHSPDVRVGNLVGGVQLRYGFLREPVAAREPLEGNLRPGRRAGPPVWPRARAGPALSRSYRHLARCGTLPHVRLVRERLRGFLRATQHRPLRPGVLPDHALRHGLLRQRNLAASGGGVLGVLRPARPLCAHGGKGEEPERVPGLRWLWRRCGRKLRELLRVLRPRRAPGARIEPASPCGRARTPRESIAGYGRVRRRGPRRRDFRRPARDPVVARNRAGDAGDADAGGNPIAHTLLRHLSQLCGPEPHPRWGRGGGVRAVRGRLRFLARAHRDRLPDGPLLHVFAHPGADDLLPRFRPPRMGLEPLRHRRFRALLWHRRRRVRLVFAGHSHRGRARDRRLSCPCGLLATPARPCTRLSEPAADARPDGPLHHNQPLDPGPTDC